MRSGHPRLENGTSQDGRYYVLVEGTLGDQNASETYTLAVAALKRVKLESDAHLLYHNEPIWRDGKIVGRARP